MVADSVTRITSSLTIKTSPSPGMPYNIFLTNENIL